MNTLMGVLAFVVILLVGVNSRHIENNDYEDGPESEHTDLLNRMRDSPSQMRHRHRSRRYPYDYQPPFYYSDYRRDYNQQQEEYFSRILKTLDEIISYMRRNPPPPPPPPQPIYIPYPVVQYQPSCNTPAITPNKTTALPPTSDSNLPSFPPKLSIDDMAQNWGLIPEGISDDIDEGDGSRPISFTPVKPSRPIKPAPPVDHGTQEGAAAEQTRPPAPKPGRCEIAIFSCCSEEGETLKKNCFVKFGCTATFSTARACHPSVIKRIVDHYVKAYAPNNSNM